MDRNPPKTLPQQKVPRFKTNRQVDLSMWGQHPKRDYNPQLTSQSHGNKIPYKV